MRRRTEEVKPAVTCAGEQDATDQDEKRALHGVNFVWSVETDQPPRRNVAPGFCPSSRSFLARASSPRPVQPTAEPSRRQEPSPADSPFCNCAVPVRVDGSPSRVLLQSPSYCMVPDKTLQEVVEKKKGTGKATLL